MTAAQYDTEIYNQAIKMGVPPVTAKLIVAQARHETGNYTNNAMKYFNAFGYKWVGQKKWAIGPANTSSEGDKYAAYKNVADSTGELVDWLKRRQTEGKLIIANLTDSTKYANALKSANYYGAPVSEYVKGLTAALKKIAIVAGTGTAAALVVVLMLFF